MKFSGMTLYSLAVAVRWAGMNGFPRNLAEWNDEQIATITEVAHEVDRRNAKRFKDPGS